MGTPKIGAVLALSGEQQYTRAIRAVNTAQRELRSEMKLVTDDFSDQANTVTALTKKYENLEKQREAQNQKIAIYTKAVKEAEETERHATENLEKAEKQYKEAKEQLNKLKQSTSATTEEVKKQEKAVKDAKEQLEVSNRAYIEAETGTSKWKNSLNNAKLELRSIDRELDKTNDYLKEAKESTDETATSIDKFGKEVKEAEEEVEVFGGVLKANLVSEVLISGAKRLGTVVGDITKASLNSGKDFETAMSTVAATMGIANSEIGDTTGSYKILQDAARKAGETTKYSATESAEALNYLALAGYDAEKSAKVLPDVLNLAAAGGMELAYASDLVTDSMAALGIEEKKLTNFTDQMAVTAQKSNTSISQLGEAVLQIGGTAKMLAGGTVELNTELGILADHGIKGAEGGTMLRNVLKNLTSPTDDASEAMKQYGIRVYDAEGNMRPLNETLGDMSNVLSGLSDQERAGVMNRIFDSRTLKGAEALIADCGDRFDELSGYISEAEGAAKEMAETMSANLSGELKILESTAESTGITLYSKFEESFKKITRSATTELGKINTELQSGKLGESMEELATEFENTAEAAIELGADALPVVIDGLSFVLENGGEIVSALSGIGAGMAAFKSATAIAETVGEIREYKEEIKATSLVQAALNKITSMNPYVLLATAIAGVGTALVTYAIASNDAEDETKNLNAEIRESIKNNKEFNNNISKNIASLKENRSEQELNAATIKRLTGELTALNGQEKLTADEQLRMQSIAAQLNQLMPDLNLSINEQTGYLNQTNQEVQNLTEHYAELARAQYYQEEITEIVKQQCEAEDELTGLMEKREETVAALASAERELNEYLKEQNITREELNQQIIGGSNEALNYVNVIDENKSVLEELDYQIKTTEETLVFLGEQYNETAEKIGDHTKLDETSEAMQSMAEGSQETAEVLSEQSAEISTAFTSMSDSIREAVKSQMDIFTKYEEQTEISGEEILENMKSQVEGIQNWGDNLSLLAERSDENGRLISEGLLSHLVDLGPEGAAYVEAFVIMGEDKLREANDLWAEAVSLPDTIAERFEEMGTQISAGLTTGIKKNVPTVEKAMTDTTDAVEGAGKKGLEMNSPSKKTMRIGQGAMEGLTKGIQDNKKTVVSAMKNTTVEVVTAAKTEMSASKGQTIGQQFSNGLASGIRSGKSEVVTAAIEVAQAAIVAAKSTLKINSPSKVTEEMGGNYVEGWIQGIMAKTENLKDAVEGALNSSLIENVQPINAGEISGSAAAVGSGENSVGSVQIYFQPQQMTEGELDRAFDYINERFGMAL